MTTQKETANWMMNNTLPLSDEANSAANGLEASRYHELVLHEEDLIADGRLKRGGQGEIRRRELKESFEEQHPDLAALMRTQHSEQPPHHFSAPKTAEELLEEVVSYVDTVSYRGTEPTRTIEHEYSLSLERYASGEGEFQTDFSWEYAATERYPEYRQEILGLRQRLKLVEEVKKHSSQEEQAQMKMLFSSVSDTIAQQFLTDILISRRILEPGIIDTRVSYQTEANNMAAELGFQQSWQGSNITPRQIAGAVLKGRLSINYQPPSPQSIACRSRQ